MNKSLFVWLSVVFAALAWAVPFIGKGALGESIGQQVGIFGAIIFVIFAIVLSVLSLKNWKFYKLIEKVFLVLALAASGVLVLLLVFIGLILSSGNLM